MALKFCPQHDQMDCGPACLSMIASYYGKRFPTAHLRKYTFITKEGVSLLGIKEAAEKIGFETIAEKANIETIKKNQQLFPAIIHWNENHFVVLTKISKSRFSNSYQYRIADPAHGILKINEDKFLKYWTKDNIGIILYLQPTNQFFRNKTPIEKEKKSQFLIQYLKPFKVQILLMFLLLLLGSGLTLILPFLTKELIDNGINAKDLEYIWLILLGQIGIFLGSLTIEIIRNWILLLVGTKMTINITSEFLKKVFLLPIIFFETKVIGDFNQRIQDNERIENFLTSQSLTTLFSLLTFGVFIGVLWYYNPTISYVYTLLSAISIIWSIYWQNKRKMLDYYNFQLRVENQENIYELINGVTEIKLNQLEDIKRTEWTKTQHKLFKNNIKILKNDQFQLSGFDFFNQIKNIIVTFISASLVINDKMTLGILLSISYIIGQLNSPINQLINFIRSLQDAKISIDRLNDFQNEKSEEQTEAQNTISKNDDITISNLSFTYKGESKQFVLQNINLTIPKGKITAIVGASGSGKTTLMKLLLRFYEPTIGGIFIGNNNLNTISPKNLRQNCGVVMQDGYIFADSIERNIATSDENINTDRLQNAVHTANITDYINELPLKFKTKIGASGNGISGGQKQRILIARAVYKNPHYIFFDEATSALDAENEKIIHENLQTFFTGKTVLIIAHRLSTVKNADQIIVLDKGKIAETGAHEQLTNKRGKYFELVKNQLELGD